MPRTLGAAAVLRSAVLAGFVLAHVAACAGGQTGSEGAQGGTQVAMGGVGQPKGGSGGGTTAPPMSGTGAGGMGAGGIGMSAGGMGAGGIGAGGIGAAGMGPGSPYEPCSNDGWCQSWLDSSVATYGRSVEIGALIAAECLDGRDLGNPPCSDHPVCGCVFARWIPYVTGGGEWGTGSVKLGDREGCTYSSRTGECLIPATDFTGCDPSDLCSCVEQCASAVDTIRAYEGHAFQVEARHAECVDQQCRVVLRVDDRCFADFKPSPSIPSYDCSLSDEEILRRAYAPTMDGGTVQNCQFGCAEGNIGTCGLGAWGSPEFYTTCEWSTKCAGDVCGTPVCEEDQDSGVLECVYRDGG